MCRSIHLVVGFSFGTAVHFWQYTHVGTGIDSLHRLHLFARDMFFDVSAESSLWVLLLLRLINDAGKLVYVVFVEPMSFKIPTPSTERPVECGEVLTSFYCFSPLARRCLFYWEVE